MIEHFSKFEQKTASIIILTFWVGKTENPLESTEKLRAAFVFILNQNECSRRYSGIITDRMICAGNNADKGVCQGDSGGPLSSVINGLPQLIGLSSFVSKCGSPYLPSVFARVSSARSWIHAITGI